MPKPVIFFADYQNRPHATANQAAISEMAEVIAGISDLPGIAEHVAREIMLQRPRIEAIFASLDAINNSENEGDL
jgi:hypothetical protein